MEEKLFRDEPADADRASQLRRELGEWLSGLGVHPDLVYDVMLATYEAIANSVEHAYRDRSVQGTLDIRIRRHAGGGIDVEVTDRGDWAADVLEANRGRGVPLIKALADTAAVVSDRNGTTVHMTWGSR